MTRALAAIALSLGLLFSLATAAHADDSSPGYVKPPYVCGPTQASSQVPCDQTPTTPPTTNPIKYCLGYGQGFPSNEPCPKPPDASCTLHPELFECHDPARTAPVPDAGIGQVEAPSTTVPPVAATAPAAPDEVSPTPVAPKTQHKAVQRVSAPPARLPATGSSSTLVIVAGLAALLVGAILILLAGRRAAVG